MTSLDRGDDAGPTRDVRSDAFPVVDVRGGLVEIEGQTWYRIDGLEHLEPFLMTVVSDDDLWMFVSSAGPLTMGRVDADLAFLPYETDDRLHRAAGTSGPVTVLVRDGPEGRELWRPYGARCLASCTRSLAKHELGTALVLEETNRAWQLTFRMTWTPSPSFGWVRRVELVDRSGRGASVEVLDGLLDIMPSGVDARTERRTSNLVDAYKRSETGRWGTAAVYSLESLITDRAEPAEALAATMVWSSGLPDAEVHLDERAIAALERGSRPVPAEVLTGRRGSYLVHSRVEVPPAGIAAWHIVVDGGLGQAAVIDRVRFAARADAVPAVYADAVAGAERLRTLVAGADGVQRTADPVADAHHLSNVLFNCMRGGVFPYGYQIPTADLVAFVSDRNRDVAARCATTLDGLAASVPLAGLHSIASELGDVDLHRLLLEYLPLTFSRRHGDPSRPWNRFSIRVRDDEGDELLTYEGNWRDIFQNWEALLRSYPAYYPHVIAKFVNASTVDGHNPYRISRDGVDWEVPDPDDPWSNIGYWGDHQIVYLNRLLEGWGAVAPGEILDWLDAPMFTYADVPYRLVDHRKMVADPRDTIIFDEEGHRRTERRVHRLGADGRLVAAGDGVVHVTFLEKLLVPALAKLSSYVPGGGIWMNTQRPEWNDANNALAGYGLSMVTLFHLDGYLGFLQDVAAGREGTTALSRPVVAWLTAVAKVLDTHPPDAGPDDPVARREVLDALGRAGDAYRDDVYDGFDPTPAAVEWSVVHLLLDAARAHLRASIVRARRPDGLFDSYNLVAFPSDREAAVDRLEPMLEGQVAVIGSDVLEAGDVVAVVEALFASDLYDPDRKTFLLYPARRPPAFLDRNTIPPAIVRDAPVLRQLVGSGPGRVLQEDRNGGLHFRPGLPNAAALDQALDGADLGDYERAAIHRIYEDLFDHHAFTGRSKGMYGYEGIGSVYWHMVSKLMLAVEERYLHEVQRGDPDGRGGDLARAYRRIRDGLGFRRTPQGFGAIPTDCYSHTPAHAGARQPGTTGQVKENVLARQGELGLVIRDGRLSLLVSPLPGGELVGGADRSYTATVCGTPVRVLAASEDSVRVSWSDGSVDDHAGSTLSREGSEALFGRRPELVSVEFRSSLWEPA